MAGQKEVEEGEEAGDKDDARELLGIVIQYSHPPD